jgi:ABC-2 type transport system permease protein
VSTVESSLPAYRVKGPSAFSGEWRRFLYLTVTLALTDWKLRFFGSVLGYVWSLLRPLLLFGILYLIFSEVVKVGAGIEHYPVVLLAGVVLYSYFAEVTGGAVSSVVDRESLVRKVTFPRMAIPLAVALVATLNLALNLITVAVFMAISGVEPRWTWLLLPIPLIALVIFATGIALLVSALYVPFRDVRPIWDVILQALFYGTPILYPVEKLIEHSQTLATIAMCSPLAVVIETFRFWLIGPSAPSAADAIGGTAMLLIPLAILVGLTALGFTVFNRMAPHVAEEL